jgi:hypothetical protein
LVLREAALTGRWCGRPEGKAVDFPLQELLGLAHVAIDVESGPDVAVPEDLLHGRRAGTRPEE